MAALACRPSGVPAARASRSRSPVDTCGTRYLSASFLAWVPLPEPGAPSNTILMGLSFGSSGRPERRARNPESGAGALQGSGKLPVAPGKVNAPAAVGNFFAIPTRPATMPAGPGAARGPAQNTRVPSCMASSKNAFYAQSGGVTAVINASACGLIETARKHRNRIGKIYAGRNGIIGALTEDLIDTSRESTSAIHALKHTPGGAFGCCRYKLKGIEENRAQYER